MKSRRRWSLAPFVTMYGCGVLALAQPVITTQPQAVTVTAGQSAAFTVVATGTPAPTYQWRRNGFNLAGATGAEYFLSPVSRTNADLYDVVVTDTLGSTTSQRVRLTVAPTAYATNLTPDPAWEVRPEVDGGSVYEILPLADGRFYVAGSFSNVNNRPATSIIRVNADGTIDSSFVGPELDDGVGALAVQADGKVLVGGSFNLVNRIPRDHLVRLNIDGSVDTTFAPAVDTGVNALVIQADGRILAAASSPLYRFNPDGSLDATFSAAPNNIVHGMAVQGDGRIIVVGSFTSVAGTTRNRVARLHANGTLDTSFDPGLGAESPVVTLARQTDGKILLGGGFSSFNGTVGVNRIVRLTDTGLLDTSFGIGSGFNGSVEAITLQGDGRILIGGSFTSYNGTTCTRLVRLAADGTLDTSFVAPAISNTVYKVTLQADGHFLVGGTFGTVGAATRTGFVRFNADLTVDPTADFALRNARDTVSAVVPLPGGQILVAGSYYYIRGSSVPRGIDRFNGDGALDPTFNAGGVGANGTIYAATVQPDGRIAVAGGFTTYNGTTRYRVAVLKADGTLDSAFAPAGTALNGTANELVVLPGGRLLVGGGFTTAGGVSRNGVAVFKADGTLDTSFNPGTGAGGGSVYAVAVQPDGKILLAGGFTTFGGQTCNRIVRLNEDGSIDPGFTPGTGANNNVFALALQTDGKIVISGILSSYNGTSRPSVARLNPDGTLDAGFVPPVSGGAINDLLVQEDGKVLLRGQMFFPSAGIAGLARLNTDGTLDPSFVPYGFSTAGMNFAALAMRDNGQVFTASRGIGFAATQPVMPPAISAQPVAQVVAAGQPATFTVVATGAPAPTYQWQKNGTAIAGATASTLSLPVVSTADAGNYSVVLTNSAGSITSGVATLTVNAVPANDNFAHAQVLNPAGGTLATDTTYATREAGEPANGANSLWYSLTPTQSGLVQITTTQANGGDIRYVYTGNSLASLMWVAGIYGGSGQPLVFGATAGVTYRIMLGAATDWGGPVTLSWGPSPVTPVTVIAQPANQTVTAGANASFSVAATGTAPFTYQWERKPAGLPEFNASGLPNYAPVANTPPYSGTNTATLTITGVTSILSGDSFRCNITNGVLPWADSAWATLTVGTAPVITGISPTSGPVGVVLTLVGANLLNVTGVTIGGVAVPAQKFGLFNGIKVIVPNGAVSGPVVATNASGSATAPTSFTVTTAGMAPTNDSFSAAATISGPSGTASGSTVYATRETGEPNHADLTSGARSVWFRWTAPASGAFVFDQSGSEFGAFLAIYTGSSLNALTPVASGNPGNNYFIYNFGPAVLTVQAGTEYFVALDGASGTSGTYSLTWNPLAAPTITSFSPSSGFAGQSLTIGGSGFVPGATVTVNGVATNASRTWANSATAITVTFLPPSATTGPVAVTTPAGTATSAANFIVTSPQAPTITSFSPASGLPGTRVTINGAALALGDAKPVVRFGGVQVPNNLADNFSALYVDVPTGATTGPITVQTSIGTATSSTNFTVPLPPVITTQPASQTATVGGVASFSVTVTSSDAVSYQWSRNGTTIVGATNATLNLVNLQVIDVGTYTVTITNSAGSVTSDAATLTVAVPAGADSFAARALLSGMTAGANVNNAAATKETGEPNHAGNAGGKSVWWSWTAPNSGAVTIDTIGSDFNTLLGVYTGTSVSALLAVASDDDTGAASGASKLTFNAVAATTYQIAVDGSGGASGMIRLSVGYAYTVINLAGSTTSGSADGAGLAARFNSPRGVAVDGAGTVFVTDSNNHTVRSITAGGTVTTLAGLAGNSGSADGTGSSARFNGPGGVAVDGSGNVYVADGGNHTIRKITVAGVVTTLAGAAGSSGSADGTGNAARFMNPGGVAVDSGGNVYVGDTFNHTIRKITAGGVVTTMAGLAGSNGSADGTGSVARFNFPRGVAVDGSGNVFVASSNSIRQISARGVVTTLAGTAGSSGKADGIGSSAGFGLPLAVALDGSGNIYVADQNNFTIRKISSGAVVTTLTPAGAGRPNSIAVDAEGNLYFLETDLNTVRKGVFAFVPLIQNQPATQTASVGASVMFSVAATSPFPMTYQWAFNGAPIPGATGSALTLNAVSVADVGSYTVTVSIASGSVTSNAANIAGSEPPPVITTQPQEITVPPGQTATLTVAATGSATLAYQWRKYGVAITGATNASYTIPSVVLTDADYYDVVVYNGLSPLVSQSARLLVTGAIIPATKEVGAGRVVYQLLVDSNADWTVTSSAPWLAVSRISGSKEGNLDVTVQPNTTAVDRTGTVTVGGLTHTVTQRAAGTVLRELWAMGSESNGQLGDGGLSQRRFPVQVAADIKAVAAGGWHSLLIKMDGSLWAVGRNSDGQLGDGTTTNQSTPVLVASNVVAVAGGAFSSLFVRADGTLWAMGYNGYGQLGDGTTTTRLTPVQVASGVSAVAMGDSHSLFLKADGTLWGMGSNSSGQLGDGTTTNRATPVQMATGVVALATGTGHSLFLKSDGTLWGTGSNQFGQLGDGTTTDRATPVQVAGGVAAMATGMGSHTLFVKLDGTLWAAGYNYSGQLGDGTTTNRLRPVQVTNGVSTAFTGGSYSLFVKGDGSLWAAGYNYSGQLGDGTTTDRATPVQVATGVSLVTAGRSHSLFLKSDGTLWAMGLDLYGQSVDGTVAFRSTPVQVAAGASTAVASGGTHSLFVKPDGTLWAMGYNYYGQLGDGTTTGRVTPVQVATGVATATAGASHSLFLRTDGTLWAMGYNTYGQLGDGTAAKRTLPVQVASGVVAVAAGNSHSLYLKNDGTLWGMGYNYDGELGDGTTNWSYLTPVRISTGVVSVTAGGSHSLFVKSDGTLWAMGSNLKGQLGDGTTTQRATPVQVASGVAAAAAGGSHSLFLKTDGTSWAMGYNYHGQLGDGTTTDRTTPVQVASGVSSVSAGGTHSLFLRIDGTLWAAGANNSGQLGDGSVTNRSVPVMVGKSILSAVAGGAQSLFITNGDPAVSAPTFVAQPAGHTVNVGTTLTLGVVVEGTGPFAYQWLKNGSPITGGSSAELVLNSVTSANAGSYTVSVSNGVGSVTSAPAVLTVKAVDGAATLGALSVRTVTGTGSAVLEGSFAFAGVGSKALLVRAVGPGLSTLGVTGVLADPQIVVTNAATGAMVASNDDWPASLASQFASAGAFPLANGSKDAALTGIFAAGVYTVRVFGPNNTTGIVLLETYQLDENPRLLYLATRGLAGAGANALVAGLVVKGNGGRDYLIRGLGPMLGSPVGLLSPRLRVYAGSTLLAETSGVSANVFPDQTAAVGAHPLAEGGRDAVLFTLLYPGAYTVQLDTTAAPRVGLIEIFEVDGAGPSTLVPAIVSQPQNIAVDAGSPAAFGVIATAKPAARYQWHKDGVALSGATAGTLAFASAQAGDSGTYKVVVSNSVGSVTSVDVALTFVSPDSSTATHAMVGSGYIPGGTATITNTITYPGTATALGWKVALPVGWSFAADAGAAGETKPPVGTTGSLEWAWTNPPASPVTFTYTVNVPAGNTGDRTVSANAIVRLSGGSVAQPQATPNPLTLSPVAMHSADTDWNSRISLLELTRVIELYNTRHGMVRTGCYKVQDTTEDGFGLEPTRAATEVVTLTRTHSADSDRNGNLSLFELTRVIELYNYRVGTVRTGAYHVQAGTEDGFAPGP